MNITFLQYNTENGIKNKEIEYNKCDEINIGDNIDILYNKDKDELIIEQYNELLKKVYYFVIIFMCIILFTFLRIFYHDNKWMKLYISLQCFLPG